MDVLYLWVGLVPLMTSCNTDWGRGHPNINSIMIQAGVGMWLLINVPLVLWYQLTSSSVTIILTNHFFQVFVSACAPSVPDTDLYVARFAPVYDPAWLLSIVSLSRHGWQPLSFSLASASAHSECRAEVSAEFVTTLLFSAFISPDTPSSFPLYLWICIFYTYLLS